MHVNVGHSYITSTLSLHLYSYTCFQFFSYSNMVFRHLRTVNKKIERLL